MKQNKNYRGKSPWKPSLAKLSEEDLGGMWRMVDGGTEEGKFLICLSAPVRDEFGGVAPEGIGLKHGIPAASVEHVATDERGKLRGYNETGGELYPRLSLKDYKVLKYLAETEDNDTILESVLSSYCKKNSDLWRNFMAVRVGKRQERADGRGDYSVVKAVAPREVPPAEAAYSKAKSTDKFKRYSLAAVFSDTFVREKYSITPKIVHDCQLLAVTDPAAAAAGLTAYMQSKMPEVKVVVSAGAYSGSVPQACHDIRMMADASPQAGVIESEVIGRKIFLFGDDREWCVGGPLKHSAAVVDVYRLVLSHGAHQTIHLFEAETLKLGIDVSIGSDVVSPTITGHVGTGSGPGVVMDPETLTADAYAKWQKLKRNLQPLYSSSGNHVASALKVEERSVLVNSHVVSMVGTVALNGEELTTHIPFGHDVFAYEKSGDYVPWVMRDAKPRDEVAVMYHNGEEVVLSPPFEVLHVDGSQIISKRAEGVSGGVSGGALVRIYDMALLGIHCGETATSLLASVISPAACVDLSEQMLDWEDSRQGVRDNSTAIVDGFKQRGLHRQFLATVEAVLPISRDGVHVGSGAYVAPGRFVTTLPAGQYDVRGPADVVHVAGFCGEVDTPDEGVSVPCVRQPEVYESVVVLGCDAEGAFASKPAKIVQVGAAGKTFVLDDVGPNVYSLAGGLVVSLQDCAVLGFYVRRQAGLEKGLSSLCCIPPPARVAEVRLADELKRAFPFLNPSGWSGEDLERVFTHPSSGREKNNLSFSKLGDAKLKYDLLVNLCAAEVPVGEWQSYVTSLQNNEVFCGLVDNLAIGKLLKTQEGFVMPRKGKGMSDLFEALAYGVYLNESEYIYKEFLSVCGVVPGRHEFKGSGAEYGRMMRRESEIGLVSGGKRVYPPDSPS